MDGLQVDQKKMSSYADSKRKHYEKSKAKLKSAKDSVEFKPVSCGVCHYLDKCREIVWTGALLPCQPTNQEAIVSVREDDDFIEQWAQSDETCKFTRIHVRNGLKTELMQISGSDVS